MCADLKDTLQSKAAVDSEYNYLFKSANRSWRLNSVLDLEHYIAFFKTLIKEVLILRCFHMKHQYERMSFYIYIYMSAYGCYFTYVRSSTLMRFCTYIHTSS